MNRSVKIVKAKGRSQSAIAICLFVAFCLLLLKDVEAVSPRIWQEGSQEAFLKGEPDGVSLTKDGTVTLAPAWSREVELLFDSSEVAIFSLAVGSDGYVYAGTSPGGLVYRIADGREPVEFCQTGDSHVFALVARPNGGLYVGTGGDQGGYPGAAFFPCACARGV